MSRSVLRLAAILILIMPFAAHASILNLRGGLGTAVERNRDTRDSTRYLTLYLASGNRTTHTDFALELPLKWEINTGKFDRSDWDRKGDWLRPVKVLSYHSGSSGFAGGLEVIDSWTPGGGYLVKDLSGRGEIDYILPGLKVGWSGKTLDVEAGMDRIVDPTVQAMGVRWKPGGGVTLILEGALDPEAPVSFSGASSGGRPVADDAKRLLARAVGVRYKLVEGEVLGLTVGAHADDINGDAKGKGVSFSASLDLSRYYLNRLNMSFGSVDCDGGYVPAWFDDSYPVYRWGPGTQPFLAVNPLDGTLPRRRMLSFDIRYDLGGFFIIKGGMDRFSDGSMKRGWFNGRLNEQNGRGIEISLWSRTENPDVRLFGPDSDVHSRVSALYNLLPHYLMSISFEHSWAFDEDEGGFLPINSIQLGMIYDISL